GRPDRRSSGTRRLPEHQFRPPRAAAALLPDGVGPRTVLLRAPHPGGRGPRTHPRTRHPGGDRPARRGPRVPDLRPHRAADDLRPPGDRGRPGGTGPLHRPGEIPPPGAAVPGPPRPRSARGDLLRSGLLQDDVPAAEASVLRGHAVRALYLTAGAIDAAVESGDDT